MKSNLTQRQIAALPMPYVSVMSTLAEAQLYSPSAAALARLGAGDWAQIDIRTDIGKLILAPAECLDEGLEIETRNDGEQRVYGRRENGRFKEIRILL